MDERVRWAGVEWAVGDYRRGLVRLVRVRDGGPGRLDAGEALWLDPSLLADAADADR